MEDKIRGNEPLDLRKVRILGEKIVSKLESKGETVRPMLRRKIQESIQEIDSEFTEVAIDCKESVIAKYGPLWDDLVELEAFHISVWGSERMCYGAIYYAYEWYLRECVRIQRGDPEYKVHRAEDFKRDLKQAFPGDWSHVCWSDQKINMARLTRNALVHNGGRITADLARQPHDFLLQGDEIQIGARDTTELYNLLKERALRISEHAASLPEFACAD